ncbi:MAG: hypothetical protein WD534_10125 [Phycisphaeraceae bacterium]
MMTLTHDSVRWLACVLFASALLPLPAWAEAEPAELAPVRTLGELREQPAVELPNGVTVRLGISAEREEREEMGEPMLVVRPNEPMLVYLLTEDDWGQPGEDLSWRRQALGPMTVHVRSRHQAQPDETLCEIAKRLHHHGDGPSLYAAAVTLPESGRWDLRLTVPDERDDEDGEAGETVVAVASVEATPQPVIASRDNPNRPTPPWLAFRFMDDNEPQEAMQQAEREQSIHQRMAVYLLPHAPRIDGAMPLWFIDDEQWDADAPLPRIEVAAEEEDRLHVVAQPTGFTLTVPEAVAEAHGVSGDAEQLLARWWVDGKPVRPDQLSESLDMMQILAEAGVRTVHVALPTLVNDLSADGAEPGATVTMQLMFAPDGHHSLTYVLMMEAVQDQMLSERRWAPLLAEPVSWQVTADGSLAPVAAEEATD